MSVGIPQRLLSTIRRGIRTSQKALQFIGSKIQNSKQLAKYETVYRLSLRLQGVRLNPVEPELSSENRNRALTSASEVETARSVLDTLGLHPHPHNVKNWDALLALQSILEVTNRDATVLDAGGATYSPLVEWLYLYGYRDLYVYNIDFDKNFRRGPIQYMAGNFIDTEFESSSFDVITILSVLEHDVNTRVMLQEFHRLLKTGGRLVVSTDFWPEKIQTEEETAYGSTTQIWIIFDKDEIEDIISEAEAVGFELTGNIDFTTDERVVSWRNHEYTFLFMEFVKRE